MVRIVWREDSNGIKKKDEANILVYSIATTAVITRTTFQVQEQRSP